MRRFVRPCPNCARPVTAAQRLFCSELCTEAASIVRYIRKVEGRGVLAGRDVYQVIETRVRMLAGGRRVHEQGELRVVSRGDQHVPQTLRAAVRTRAGDRCEVCGEPGSDLHHLQYPARDADDLQLLCQTCHDLMPRRVAVGRPNEAPFTVDALCRMRARETEPRQPSDAPWWARSYRLWVPDREAVPGSRWEKWREWAYPAGVSPVAAAAGFPSELDPWAWFTGPRRAPA